MAPLPSQQDLLDHFGRCDPRLAGVIEAVGPFQLRRNRNHFQVLCKAIVSQQISTSAAESVFRRVRGLFPQRKPTPSGILELSHEALRGAGLSRQKSSYLKDLGHKFHEGALQPRRFAHMDNEQIVGQLTQVRGIGRWTAEMFLIFSLNRLNVLPVDDLGLRTAVKHLYRMRDLPDARRLRTLGRRWHPLETVATWYAWRSLNPDIVKY